MRSGARSKLTKKFIAQAAAYIADGNYAETACKFLGIADCTYYMWLAKGREDKKNGVTKSAYVEFLDAITQASAEAEVKNIACIQSSASKGNVKAAMWWLEHRYPKRWSGTTKIDCSGRVNVDLNSIDVSKIPTLLLEEILNNKGVLTDEHRTKLKQYGFESAPVVDET